MRNSLSADAKGRIVQQLDFLEKRSSQLVIDGDTHLTSPELIPVAVKGYMENEPNYFHGRPITVPELLREMDMARVDMALCWQNPSCTTYSGDRDANYQALLEANRYIFRSSIEYPQRIIPAGWTDPRALGIDGAIRLAEKCVDDFGFGIVKLNPAQNEFPIDSPEVMEVVDAIVKLGAVPAFHFGADTEFTPAEGLIELARRHPHHPLLGVHMGGGGASYPATEMLCHQAREAGLQHPNLRFVLSAKRDTHIESDLITYTLAGEPFMHNLFCASDAPYGRICWNFGGFREVFKSLDNNPAHPDSRVAQNPHVFTSAVAQGYLGGNLANFLIEIYRRILGV